MRKVIRTPCPPDLDQTSPANEVNRERQNAKSALGKWNLGQCPNRKLAKFKFKQHRRAAQELDKIFLNKCAYCESRFRGNVDSEVEHIRPKGGVRVSNKDVAPGYYWLATSWDNLVPSCPVCNKRQRRIVAGGKEKMCGKGVQFPLFDEAKRATQPGHEVNEEPKLLDPCADDVDRYFEFEEDGTLRPSTKISPREQERAKETIRVLGLDRESLRAERERVIKDARVFLEHLRYNLRQFVIAQKSSDHKAERLGWDRVLAELHGLRRRMDPEADFSVAVRQVLVEDLKKLTLEFAAEDLSLLISIVDLLNAPEELWSPELSISHSAET